MTIDAVESLRVHLDRLRHFDIHVLDNNSDGDDAEILRRAHDERNWGSSISLYAEHRNHGFGRANNLVFSALEARETPPDLVMLLNPDAALENDAIDLLAAALEADPRAGFAGAGISKPDGTPVVSAFRFPNVIDEFSSALNFGPMARLCRKRQVALPPDTPGGRVDWVSGAAVMIRMECLREIGFFDPDFFLYYEEVELMHRGSRRGWHSIYVPEARVVHAEGAATGVASGQPTRKRRPHYWYRSWRLYYIKTGGRMVALLAALSWAEGAAGDYVIAWLRGRQPHAPLHFFGDFWRGILRPLIAGSEVSDAT